MLIERVEEHAPEAGVKTLTAVAGLNAAKSYERVGFA